MQNQPRGRGPEQIALQIPCRYSYLRIVRQAVGDLCAQTCVSEFKAAQLEMAVDEVCAELIGQLRQRPEGGGRSLQIMLGRQSGEIAVQICYPGDKVECPALASPPVRPGEDAGSLGSYVVQRFVDRVEHVHDPESGWCVRLHKRI